MDILLFVIYITFNLINVMLSVIKYHKNITSH